MDLLFSEFIDDNVMSHGKHSINNRHAALWNLTKTLIEAFNSITPLNHPLFKNNSQLNHEGCQKLYKCYNAGLERLKEIYRQEILQIETIDTRGRRAKEVIVSKVKDVKKAEKEAEKAAEKKQKIATQKHLIIPIQKEDNSKQLFLHSEEFQSISDPNSINAEYISEPLSKKQKVIRHQTTELEKNLLAPLMTPNSPTEEEIEEVLKLLL